MAAIVLLCLFVMPVAQASNSNTTPANATVAQQSAEQQNEDKATKAKPKTAIKPREKSVLDTDVLESPVAYFRDAFSSEEDGTGSTAPKSGVVMITLKALIATLLSTVM
ncbi:hypothetical protein CA264_16895 [Pontibacter actiniarum]|uniref:Uncharacterized protein n=2 Tax=Pontibacter actiniarum TaxID=323450 RepID=A0A1X9YVQ8_9BACT|nr:hypothetical protein CA264_16895 [Pontibacter actiniarum]